MSRKDTDHLEPLINKQLRATGQTIGQPINGDDGQVPWDPTTDMEMVGTTAGGSGKKVGAAVTAGYLDPQKYEIPNQYDASEG